MYVQKTQRIPDTGVGIRQVFYHDLSAYVEV
jgi:hypothetical protein